MASNLSEFPPLSTNAISQQLSAAAQEINMVDHGAMQAVREFFENMTQSEALQYCLGIRNFPDAPPLAQYTTIICFDTEGWNPDSRKLTEVGFNGFNANDMRSVKGGPWGENYLRNIHFYHARISENAHLRNKSGTMGDAEKNRFGQSRFLSGKETRVALEEFFATHTPDGKGICPVIVLGHALGGDTEKLFKLLSFSTDRLGNVVKECDTQTMVRELGFWTDRNQIGLQRLIFELGFQYRDAHTASNDAAMTTIAAILLVLENNGFSEEKNLQDVIDGVEAASQDDDWIHGSDKYCTRCHAVDHVVNDRGDGQSCRKHVHCAHCRTAGRGNAQWGHSTSDCISYALANGNSKIAADKKKAEREAAAEKARLEGRDLDEVMASRPRRDSHARRGTLQTMSGTLELPLHNLRTNPKTTAPFRVYGAKMDHNPAPTLQTTAGFSNSWQTLGNDKKKGHGANQSGAKPAKHTQMSANSSNLPRVHRTVTNGSINSVNTFAAIRPTDEEDTEGLARADGREA